MRTEGTVRSPVWIEQHASADVQLVNEAGNLHCVVILGDAEELNAIAVAMTQPLQRRKAFAARAAPSGEQVDNGDAPANGQRDGIPSRHRRERQRRQRITDQDGGEEKDEHEL